MTTTIIVDAHAGWPVRVTSINRGVETDHLVAPLAKQSFSVWDGQDLLIHEIQPHDGGRSLDFAAVIRGVKAGKRFARAGWNGKNMFVFLVPGSTFKVNREPLLSILGEGTEVNYHGHIDMRTANGQIVPWLASQTDMLAEDWQEV